MWIVSNKTCNFVCIKKSHLIQSEHIEPVLPQAEQLGIHFYCFHNTQIEMRLLERPDQGQFIGKGK